ncbi:NADPH-dependent F420 reductase [Leuconostoc inhae]|uniref:NADPH-dependent F420 reductase n=1 Tax=Leuconostoc inhae TaxID=178001 RepID=UPI001C7D75A9|nr:NAD(P)-binding domain-containing protein [Leuconostoc inhae]
MSTITIFGKGNMGTAIGQNFSEANNSVNFIESDDVVTDLGDIIVLAVPYDAAKSIVTNHKADLAGKIVIDITNPVNFETWDGLVVPADSSAAAEFAAIAPDAKIVKGFNTTFASTLATKTVNGTIQTTVQLASDDQTAKETIIAALVGSGLAVIDAGSLLRARELESLGFLQLTLASKEVIGWTGGFGLVK